MALFLSEVLTRYRRDPRELQAEFNCPVLVWMAPAIAESEPWAKTDTVTSQRPAKRDPIVFQVQKTERATNFPLGVTLGRVESNDLVIDDDSVSRFHAFFRLEERQVWFVTDAESRNGTWVDDLRLTPSERVPLRDGSALRFGDAAMKFFLPAAFHAFVEGAATESPGGAR